MAVADVCNHLQQLFNFDVGEQVSGALHLCYMLVTFGENYSVGRGGGGDLKYVCVGQVCP